MLSCTGSGTLWPRPQRRTRQLDQRSARIAQLLQAMLHMVVAKQTAEQPVRNGIRHGERQRFGVRGQLAQLLAGRQMRPTRLAVLVERQVVRSHGVRMACRRVDVVVLLHGFVEDAIVVEVFLEMVNVECRFG